MSPLQSIPANVRTALYWVGYVAGVIGQGITIVWGAIAAASPEVSMPLGLVIASAVLGLLQTQLNLIAGSNVVDTESDAAGRILGKAVYDSLPPTVEEPGGMQARDDYAAGDPGRA